MFAIGAYMKFNEDYEPILMLVASTSIETVSNWNFTSKSFLEDPFSIMFIVIC